MATDGAQPDGLGAELKRRREERAIDLQEISNATRIGVRYLRAIEQDDFNALPGGLFTRAFIRTYSRYVGMDETKALEQYSKQTNQGVDEAGHYQLATENVRRRARERFWTTIAILFAIMIVLGLGALAGWHFWHRTRGQITTSAQRFAPAPAGAQTTPPPPVPAPIQPPAADAGPPVTTPAGVASSGVSGAVPPKNSDPLPSTREAANENAAQSLASQPKDVSSAAMPRFEVRLEATDVCYISVLSDQGKAHQETLRVGETRTFSPQRQVVLSASNFGSLRVLINDKPARLPASGRLAGNVLISRENYQQFVGR